MNEVVIYESSEIQIQVEVVFDGETAWSTQNQLSNLLIKPSKTSACTLTTVLEKEN
ncbi:hypothetical protein [Cellulophaga baltica]|uniref:hypothetical protein n=1 Tax=Cellulophaga baltica TaxID=76594 RepID=UPI00130E76EB|nr:hypothetical protein [Cellulophaga baltica]